jgi:hypothetical protein
VTKRPGGKGGEGAFDGLPIGAVAFAEQAAPDEMVDPPRTEHQLHRYGTAFAAFAAAALPLGGG